VTFNALPNVDGTGAVAQIDPTSTTSNSVVQYGVTVSLDQADASLRPGQSATITVTTAEADNALWVPTQAVHTGGGSSTVTVLRNGKQVSVPVTLGVQGDRQTQISSGLSQGEQVVLTIATTSNGNLGNTGRFGGNGNRLGGNGGAGTLPGGTLGGGR
jgi:membrane fusion protein, macrolide-specific efflux system